MSKVKIRNYYMLNSPSQYDRIDDALKTLKLEAMRTYFRDLINQYSEENGSYSDFLESLLAPQMVRKEDGRVLSATIQAGFGKRKTLESFKFPNKTNINQRQITELASCNYINEKRNIILLGPSALGKTHLAKGLGEMAIRNAHSVRFFELDKLIALFTEKNIDVEREQRLAKLCSNVELLILDEMRPQETTPRVKSFLYRVLRSRYEDETGATIFTSNRAFSEWGILFGNDADPILRRIYERAIVFNIEGEPYNLEAEQTN